jgi:hypothetical protein
VKREVADDLARSGMIRVEEAIEEDDAGHCPERVRSRVRGGKVSPKNSAAFFGASQPPLCRGDEPALDVHRNRWGRLQCTVCNQFCPYSTESAPMTKAKLFMRVRRSGCAGQRLRHCFATSFGAAKGGWVPTIRWRLDWLRLSRKPFLSVRTTGPAGKCGHRFSARSVGRRSLQIPNLLR